ncbi:DNA gyrase subunit A [Tepiditoga spiralis]|uniref:DNA topoisomerase (ATP-hydrolyzing) n=2 Tax=Tepiditoga spiralis TaxID=2108365 RepID=A0A7G1GBD5_9BACT|nr:DNA gyrase subunit A [Tepiditoga spiralis]BBE31702.1 DNA gyrase subunit A [Tepiditoga spiralis]
MSENNEEMLEKHLVDRRFTDEMKESYLLYSLSVIVSRAIPDARDGLKPVQRRILYSMDELGLKHTSAYKKSARIIGEVMGKYHPHGDASIYDALVRMAQDFSMRYQLVNGQGNFGSIDRDPPAAMRYTEAKMQTISEYMLQDIEKDTVAFNDNFDGSLREPEVLPTRLPNLLMNGVSGIAVGMATSIPPHNLRELVGGFKYLIDNPEATVPDLMQYIKGPDLPTGGIIVDGERIRDFYETGRGKFTTRAKYEIVENKNKSAIVVTEIPYNVSKIDIIEQIVAYVKRMRDMKKDSGISDLRDESDRRGMRLVIELKRNANQNRIINDLLKHTSLQSTFSIQMNVIDNKKPSLMNLKGLMNAFINHRVEVVTRRTNYELKKAEKRAHIVEGLIKAVQGIDTVIEIIRNSDNPQDALKNLQETIGVSAEQAKAISEMRLISLSKLEINKLTDELKDLNEKIKWANEVLENTDKKMEIIKSELDEIDKKFGDDRRTEITFNLSNLKSNEELIEDEDIVIVLSQYGYIMAVPSTEYKVQGRGGKGVKGLKISDNDNVLDVIFARRKSKLMIITSAGKAYQLPAYEIELAAKNRKGKHVANYVSLSDGEKIKTVVPIGLDGDYDKFVMFFTKKGKVKKTSLREFANARKSGIKALNLKEDDEVVDALIISNDSEEVLIVTKRGMALKFSSSDARAMGRTAGGVIAIKLKSKDEVVNAVKIDNNKKLLIVTENGYAKRAKFSSYRLQSRGGIGLKTIKDINKIGNIVAALSVEENQNLLSFSKNGKAIRVPISSINTLGRVTQGVITVRLDKGDLISSVIIVNAEEEEEI